MEVMKIPQKDVKMGNFGRWTSIVNDLLNSTVWVVTHLRVLSHEFDNSADFHEKISFRMHRFDDLSRLICVVFFSCSAISSHKPSISRRNIGETPAKMFQFVKIDWNIYSLTWYFLQFLFDVFEFICGFVIYPVSTIKRYLPHRTENYVREKQFIESHKKHLDKIPYHLAVILGTEVPDFHVLSKMIFWCFSVGIPNISFYDHEGIALNSYYYFQLLCHLSKFLTIFLFSFQDNWWPITINYTNTCHSGGKIMNEFVGTLTHVTFAVVKLFIKMAYRRSYRWISYRHVNVNQKLLKYAEI